MPPTCTGAGNHRGLFGVIAHCSRGSGYVAHLMYFTGVLHRARLMIVCGEVAYKARRMRGNAFADRATVDHR